MTKYIVKSYLALINRFDAFAKNLGSFGLAVIYTICLLYTSPSPRDNR